MMENITEDAELNEIIDTGVIVESFSSLGHKFRFAFSVLDLVDAPYTFKRDIETECEILPTSWSLEFRFEQATGTDIASCTLITRRTDSMDSTVKANIELSFSYVDYPCQQLEQLFQDEFKSGEEVLNYIGDILPFPEERELYIDWGITVEVSLSVNCCDQEERSVSGVTYC